MADASGPRDLERLERSMRALVAGRDDPVALPADEFIAPLPGLAPADQVRVYRDGWFGRLRDCIEMDFPCVAATVGHDAWADLMQAYLAAHPPRHYDVGREGDRFVGFLAGRDGLAARGALVDLARLEWALAELFLAPDAPILSPESLAAVPPERFPAARFAPAPTAVVLDLDHPVHTVFTEWKESGTAPAELPGPSPAAVLVGRNAARMWRVSLDPGARGLLGELLGGAPLGEALERCAEATGSEPAALAGRLEEWFRDWTRAGAFGAVAFEA